MTSILDQPARPSIGLVVTATVDEKKITGILRAYYPPLALIEMMPDRSYIAVPQDSLVGLSTEAAMEWAAQHKLSVTQREDTSSLDDLTEGERAHTAIAVLNFLGLVKHRMVRSSDTHGDDWKDDGGLDDKLADNETQLYNSAVNTLTRLLS